MRIGIDCRMFRTNFTGIGRYTSELIKNLQALSRTTPEVQRNEYILFFNDPEFDLFTPTEPNFKKVLVNAPHYSFREQTRFLRILNKENLDLMHFTHFNAPILYRKPFIVTIHDLTHTLFPGRKMTSLPFRLAYKKVIKNSVSKAKFVIAVSNNTRQDVIKILKPTAEKAEKIHVIYEGANEEFRRIGIKDPAELADAAQALKAAYGITTPFLLYTGVHRYHKNLQRLVEAFATLMAKRGEHATKRENLSLVITGKPDPLYPEAEQEVAKHNLQDKVIFTGLVPEKDLVALYNLATAYVFPSLYEGFGLPILEAFACGTPVIASNVSSIPEVVGKSTTPGHGAAPGHGTTPDHISSPTPNALFFNPYDVKDIAEKIDQLLADPSLQKDLAQRGLERVKDFSWEKMARSIADLYNSAQ